MLGWLTDAASRLSRAASTTSAFPLTLCSTTCPRPTTKTGRQGSAASGGSQRILLRAADAGSPREHWQSAVRNTLECGHPKLRAPQRPRRAPAAHLDGDQGALPAALEHAAERAAAHLGPQLDAF